MGQARRRSRTAPVAPDLESTTGDGAIHHQCDGPDAVHSRWRIGRPAESVRRQECAQQEVSIMLLPRTYTRKCNG
jgi:hypothetical protein